MRLSWTRITHQMTKVLFDDPLASYGGAQKFWDHLGSFRQAYLLQSVDGDAPGIVSVK